MIVLATTMPERINRIMRAVINTSIVAILTASPLHAAAIIDIAANYGGVWGNGQNAGTGFLPWSIIGNNGGGLFSGSFIGSSTDGAGNINTGGVAFGLFANPAGAFVNADRAFVTTLSPGETFSFDLAVNFDNGAKGFNLYAGSQGQVFNFNLGSGASVSAGGGASLTAGPGAGYNYGGNDAVINVEIQIMSTSQFAYLIGRTSSQGNQGTLFSGTVQGLVDDISGFRFYVSGTDDGAAQNNLYINNLSVVPEPSAGVIAAAGLIPLLRRRRTRGA